MAENFGIGLRVQLQSSKDDIKRQIGEIQQKITQSIKLDVKVDVTKKDVLEQLSKVTGKSLADVIIKVKIDDKVTYINDQIKTLSKKINEALVVKLKLDAKEILVETQKVKQQVQQTMAQSPHLTNQTSQVLPNPATTAASILNDNKAEFLKADLASINKSINETLASAKNQISKISVDMGKDLGINKAVVSYTNEVGIAVKETMRWTEHINDANKAVLKFETIHINTVQDFEKGSKAVKDLDLTISKLQGKLIGISEKKYAIHLDSEGYKKVDEDILNLKNHTGSVVDEVRRLRTEMNNLDNNAKKGYVQAQNQPVSPPQPVSFTREWKPSEVLKVDKASIEKSIIETLSLAEGKVSKLQVDMGKDLGVNKAVVSYTNSVGNAVKETLKWKDEVNSTGQVIKRVFETSNITVVQDFEKGTKVVRDLDLTISQLQNKLIVLSEKKYSVNLDSNGYKQLDTDILNLKNHTGDITSEIKRLKTELNNLDTNARKSYAQTQQNNQQTAQPFVSPNRVWKPAEFLKADQASIEKSIMDTIGVAEGKISKIQVLMGKDLGVNKAVVEYTNTTGKAVVETMRWKDEVNATGQVIKRVFGTSDIKIVENFKTAERAVVAIDIAIEKMQSKLNGMSEKHYAVRLDQEAIKQIDKDMMNLYTHTGDVTKEINRLNIAIAESDAKAKIGYAQQTKEKALENRTTLMNSTGVASLPFTGISSDAMKESINVYMSQAFGGKNFEIKELGMITKSLDGMSGTMNQAVVKMFDGRKVQEFRVQVDEATKTVRRFESVSSNASNKDLGFGGQLQNAAKAFPIWMIAATAWMQALNAIKDGIKYVADMDSAMVELGKVTDFTNHQMEGLRQQAVKTGVDLGKSTADIMKSYAEIARVHKDTSEIVELGRVATMASNVTSLTAEQASKALSTSMLTFKLGVGDAKGLLDQWNEIQNNYRKMCAV